MFCPILGIFEVLDSSTKEREAALLLLVKSYIHCLVFLKGMGHRIALCSVYNYLYECTY